MHTRLIYRGDDLVNGFNSDIDPAALDHKVIQKSNRFYIGIPRRRRRRDRGDPGRTIHPGKDRL